VADGELDIQLPTTRDACWTLGFRHAIAHLVPKDVLIGTIFKYMVVRVDTVVPPAMVRWYNPNVPIHDYNPGSPFWSSPADHDTCGILKAAGYFFQDRGTPNHVDSQDYWSYDSAGKDPIGTIQLASPIAGESPTSWTIVNIIVTEMASIGLNNIAQTALTFPSPLWSETVYYHIFDMYFGAWTLSEYPDYLWNLFHSANDRYMGGFNTPGLHDSYIDYLVNIIKGSADETEVRARVYEVQSLLMDPQNPYGLCYIPIYSRNYINAYDRNLQGILNMPGYGSDNYWTWLNMNWSPPAGKNQFTYILDAFPDTFSPLSSIASEDIACWRYVFDNGMDNNPYTLADIPGLVTAWSTEPYGTGARINFTLREGVKWHCGKLFTAYDAKFSYDYLAKYEPGLWADIWEFYDKCEIVNPPTANGGGKISIYVTVQSPWLLCNYAKAVGLLPKHIWNDANRDGIEGDEVTDWQHFNLWEYTHPPVDGVVPTEWDPITGASFTLSCLCGTGPWEWESFSLTTGICELVANRNYFRTQTQVESDLASMFHWFGDVNSDGVVDGWDMALMGLAWGTRLGDPKYDQRCDLNRDDYIDAEDLRIVGFAYGKKKWYP
jgi:ABC-type transport system substrate-binding protein